MLRWWRSWINRGRVEQDLDAEVRAHFETLVERRVAQGVPEEEARRAVRLQFGGPEQVKEEVRQSHASASFEAILQDIRYAFRTLRKNPGFTVVAIVTLALGIGANTAIFSLMNAVVMRLLPVERPKELVLLTDPEESGAAVDTTEHGVRSRLSYPEFQELRSHQTVFSGLFAAENQVPELEMLPLGGRSGPSMRVRTQLVSGEFFPVLGVQAVIGRVFGPEEDRAPGAGPVAVASYGFWQREFAGRPAILDTPITMGKGVFRIVGVTPAGFHGVMVGSDPDLWFPVTMQA